MVTRKALENLYKKYNKRKFVHPDPLEFLYQYDRIEDREIVALVASSLAYGRVRQILKSVSIILEKMGRSPFAFLTNSPDKRIYADFSSFKHRFTTGDHMANLLINIKKIIIEHGSLNKKFTSSLKKTDATLLPALIPFAEKLASKDHALIPLPERGSACKRLNLFLRWMVRSDQVDPGGWVNIPVSKLIIPLDTHMHKIALIFKLTKRRQADIKTALEITRAFSKISPKDPVKYDFALTRFGIRNELSLKSLSEFA